MPTPSSSQEFATYRHKVTLQRVTYTVGLLNQKVPTWNDLKSFFGFLRPISGVSYTLAKQLSEQTTHVLDCRWLGEVVPIVEDRVLYNGKVFNIESVINENEMNYKYTISLKEGEA